VRVCENGTGVDAEQPSIFIGLQFGSAAGHSSVNDRFRWTAGKNHHGLLPNDSIARGSDSWIPAAMDNISLGPNESQNMIPRRTGRKEKGSTLIEFTLVGIPLLLVFISLIEMCIAMWSYHTLAYALREGVRFASTKGQGCTYTGNTCSVTVGDITQQITTAGTGLVPGQLNVTFTSSAGNVSCSPITSCSSNTTVWPPSSGNLPGSVISVSGTYPVQTRLVLMFFPGAGASQMNSISLAASSQQIIQF
jgi:Flp pilus assembly protein TadG